MNSSLKKIQILITGALIAVGMFAVVSCSGKEDEPGGSMLTIGKDGTVHADIVENFEKGYYNKDELQRTILEQTATYNRNTGSGNVTVEKVEVEDAQINVQMTYAGASDYAALNNAVFFAGTAMEAQEAGYNLNVVLSSVKNSQETIGKADILALENGQLLITNVNEGIKLSGKALYVSDNVTPASNAKKVWYTGDEDGLAYIIYK